MVQKQEDNLLQVDVFHAISDPTRRSLLDLIAHGEQPVKTLAKAFAMSRPAISQHLRILKQAGLVVERRAGREHLYRLQADPLHEVSDWVHRVTNDPLCKNYTALSPKWFPCSNT